MRNILLFGAGKSASSLIKYLLDKSKIENLHLTIADLNKPNDLPQNVDFVQANLLYFKSGI